MEPAHARLKGTGPALAGARRRAQRRPPLSRVRCLGCDTHQTVALDAVRGPKSTPIHELERYMRCKDCSEVRGYAYKRSHLVALRTTMISALNPPATWWPGRTVNALVAPLRGSDRAARRPATSHPRSGRGLHHEAAQGRTEPSEWQAATEALIMAAEDRGPITERIGRQWFESGFCCGE